MHETTFGGGALTKRVALELMQILADLLTQISHIGEFLRQELRKFGRKYSFVQEVRGLGLMIGVQLAIREGHGAGRHEAWLAVQLHV